MLRLVGVSKRFDSGAALQPLDLEIETARTTVLLGPSGCGKTTALRLMLGLIAPDAGQVLFRGAPLREEHLLQARHAMGYVVQDGGLFPHLTALGNVRLMARYLAWPEARITERVQELAELVHLPDAMLARYPNQISGGQKQRVALMRALVLDPELLFLDEPLGALDPMVRADLQDDLARIFERLGKTVVLVTHDLAEAAFFGHVLVLLQAGRIVQCGSLRDFTAQPADPFVTRFVRAQRRFESEPTP
ncbi:MAG: ATP-binding cassette domain-containing protein [Polyangiaceae bacterium]